LLVVIQIQSRKTDSIIDKSKTKKVFNFTDNSKRPVALFLGFVIGAGVSSMPMVSSIKFRDAVQSGDATRIQEAAYLSPLESFRMYQVASVLQENQLNAEALTVARDAVKTYPRSFDLWGIIYNSPVATETEKAEALTRIKQLDPFNPIFK